jgi:hypothetical protein
MKNYFGSINYIEGRGSVLVTKIPVKDKLPKVGSFIMTYGHKLKVLDVECARHGKNSRAEMVGILLDTKQCKHCRRTNL